MGEYYTSPNKQTAIKLDMLPGDQSLVAALSPEGTRGVSFFVYPNGTATIIGCQSREDTVALLEDALETLKDFVPRGVNLHEPKISASKKDPEKPS